MSLLDQLTKDMVVSMKAKDKETLSVVRMLKAAVANEKIKLGHDLSDDEANGVLAREFKQRKESLVEFEKAGREDLIKQMKHELEIVSAYMPKQLSESEVAQIVKETVAQVKAESMKDFGKVMGAIMPKVKGKADGKVVNELVKKLLQK